MPLFKGRLRSDRFCQLKAMPCPYTNADGQAIAFIERLEKKYFSFGLSVVNSKYVRERQLPG
jgi:hypothetical protein